MVEVYWKERERERETSKRIRKKRKENESLSCIKSWNFVVVIDC